MKVKFGAMHCRVRNYSLGPNSEYK